MKVLLFALTGFGNRVFDALLQENCEVGYVFTRREPNDFPYYEEENLAAYASSKNTIVYEEFDWLLVKEIIVKYKPDLLLVSTFHKIIPEDILLSVPKCINFHPSLLPKYRGSTPIAWVLHNKEKETGITAHWLTKELDAGDILVQEIVEIKPNYDFGVLFKKLALTAGLVCRLVITQIKAGTLVSKPQDDENRATYFPKLKL